MTTFSILPSATDPAIKTFDNPHWIYVNRDKKALVPERVKELCARVGNGERKAALAREFRISRETLYQYLRQNADRKAGARSNGKGDK